MDGVGQQRHRATDDHDNDLQASCHPQHQQADLDRPNTRRTRLQCVIDRIMRVMGVRHQTSVNSTPDSDGMHMTVIVGAIMIYRMTVSVG
jgi:hypothetical protein